jgi:hypothetical protein
MIGRHKMEYIKNEVFLLLSSNLDVVGESHICLKKCKYCKHVDVHINRIRMYE